MTQAPAVPAVTLPLSEVFGPTFQGEGPALGQRCWFVRLGLCNLSCEWCDTPYTWDTSRFDVKAECPDTPVEQIITRLEELGALGFDRHPRRLVVVSGGEPLMHHQRLGELLSYNYRWHVETNGTIAPPDWWRRTVEHTTVSPKVITTSDPIGKRLKAGPLAAWAEHAHAGLACFKFVAATAEDVWRIDGVVTAYDLPREHVWIMPEGTTPSRVLRHQQAIAEAVLRYGFHFTTRLHTLLWGDERGH